MPLRRALRPMATGLRAPPVRSLVALFRLRHPGPYRQAAQLRGRSVLRFRAKPLRAGRDDAGCRCCHQTTNRPFHLRQGFEPRSQAPAPALPALWRRAAKRLCCRRRARAAAAAAVVSALGYRPKGNLPRTRRQSGVPISLNATMNAQLASSRTPPRRRQSHHRHQTTSPMRHHQLGPGRAAYAGKQRRNPGLREAVIIPMVARQV